MKSLKFSMSLLAAATLATSVHAAQENHTGAAVLAPSTVQAVSSFLDGHANQAVAGAPGVAGAATRLVIYPTANRHVVFVTFESNDGTGHRDRIGMANTRGGRVVAFTDFTGPQPRQVRAVTAARREDAQSQARALLVSAAPLSQPTSRQALGAPRQVPVSAQSQAADLLRSTPSIGQASEPRRVVALGTPGVHGDSQAMARALLTWTAGE